MIWVFGFVSSIPLDLVCSVPSRGLTSISHLGKRNHRDPASFGIGDVLVPWRVQGGPLPSYKWSYKSIYRGYNPSYPFIRPFIGVITLLITSKGPPCSCFCFAFCFDNPQHFSHIKWCRLGIFFTRSMYWYGFCLLTFQAHSIGRLSFCNPTKLGDVEKG